MALYRRIDKTPPPAHGFAAALAQVQDQVAIEVWPENWPAFHLFTRVSTQWRVGMGGAVGLDYNVPLRLMDRMHLSDTDYDQLIDDIGVMEQAALAEMKATD